MMKDIKEETQEMRRQRKRLRGRRNIEVRMRKESCEDDKKMIRHKRKGHDLAIRSRNKLQSKGGREGRQ